MFVWTLLCLATKYRSCSADNAVQSVTVNGTFTILKVTETVFSAPFETFFKFFRILLTFTPGRNGKSTSGKYVLFWEVPYSNQKKKKLEAAFQHPEHLEKK